jgi:hypothetical protein
LNVLKMLQQLITKHKLTIVPRPLH